MHSNHYLVCRITVHSIQHGADCCHSSVHYAWSSRIDVDSHDERIVPDVQGEKLRCRRY